MRVHFLGSGTSNGVPEIGCNCYVCQSSDARDKRTRASVVVKTDNGEIILIDCGPDFRSQILSYPVPYISAVLLTHEHYDHVGGMDDLRPFVGVPVYALDRVCQAVRRNMPYCFTEVLYQGVPQIKLNVIDKDTPFYVGATKIIPIECYHAKLPIIGYRIDNFAYITDISSIEEVETRKLDGIDVLVVDALRFRRHFSHFSVGQAIKFAESINPRPKKVYFTHIAHHMGLHSEIDPYLPEWASLAYDGLEVSVGKR